MGLVAKRIPLIKQDRSYKSKGRETAQYICRLEYDNSDYERTFMSQYLKQATDFDADAIRLAISVSHSAAAALNTTRPVLCWTS